jgi:hypothetical protein
LLDNDRETNETTATAIKQLCRYAAVLEPFLGSGLNATIEILLEAVFCMGVLRGSVTRPTECKGSVGKKKFLIVSLKGLGAKTN